MTSDRNESTWATALRMLGIRDTRPRTIDGDLRRLRRLLRRYGLRRALVRTTIDDLRVDLDEAVANGAGIESVLGTDLKAFAAQIAEAHGRAPVPGRHALIVVTMGLPLALIALLTYVGVGGGENIGLAEVRVGVPSGDGQVRDFFAWWLPPVVYGAATILGVAAAFAFTGAILGLAGDSRIGATFRRMLVTMPIGGFIGVVSAMLVAASTDYRTTKEVILVEAAVAAAFVVVAMVVGREWARRLPRSGAAGAAAPEAKLARIPR